jgi:diguanylate cyclase (GGDEF)-like protein
MEPRYRALTVYVLLLACCSGAWLLQVLGKSSVFPPPWAIALCVGACLFVFQFGLRAPRIGLISMERVPQVALLLTVSVPVAATICAIGSFLWPLVNREYSQRSIRFAFLRGLHNAAMTVLMLLVAGFAYTAFGGRHPLGQLTLDLVAPLLAMALAMQFVNIALMSLFFKFDGRDARRILTPTYALSDLLFVPGGVLVALLYNTASTAAFGMLIGLFVIFVLSFHGMGPNAASQNDERGPLMRLFRARLALHGARTVDSLCERVVSEVRTLFKFDEFYLVLANRGENQLELRFHERRNTRLPVRTKPLHAGIFGQVLQSGKSVLVADWTAAPGHLQQVAEVTDKDTGSVLVVPLLEKGVAIGLLSLQHTTAGVYSDADLNLLERLAADIALAMSDARAYEDADEYRQRLEQRVAERTADLERASAEKERLLTVVRERSQTFEREAQEDPLTGIANRRCFLQRLAAEIELAKVVGHPLTLAIADLDFFKMINDRLGHIVGDEVLVQSAALMRSLCGNSDLVARIGGEEFAWILPGTDLTAAFRFCETARTTIEGHDWSALHPELRPTISIGLWQWDGNASVHELLRAADTQLYAAKHAGRNRVA